MQTTALLKSARILWRFLEKCENLLSLRLQCKLPGRVFVKKNLQGVNNNNDYSNKLCDRDETVKCIISESSIPL